MAIQSNTIFNNTTYIRKLSGLMLSPSPSLNFTMRESNLRKRP
jgi:hypothetical protein